MSVFPGSLDTDATLYVAKDYLQSTLLAAQAIGDTVAVLVSGAGWAANMILSVDVGASNPEQQLVTGVAGNVLTVTRSFGGTSASAHAAGAVVSNNVDAAYQLAAKQAIIAIEAALGANLSNIPTLPAAAAQLQYFRTKPNSGNLTTFEFAALPDFVAADYNFAPITPTGSPALSAGANTVTLPVMPLGINATSVNTQSLYISGGTGTAEAVPIIGCSATTVTFTCANTHSGAYTVASATGGFGEALCAAAAVGGGKIRTSVANPCTFHGVSKVPAGASFVIDGGGSTMLSIIRAADYPNGALIFVLGGAALQVQDLGITNSTVASQTSEAALHFQLCSARVRSVSVWGGYRGIILDGTSLSTIIDYFFYGSAAGTSDGLIALANSGMPTSDTICIGCRIYNVLGAYCVRLQGADSFHFIGCSLGFGQYQFVVAPDAGASVVNWSIIGGEMDTPGVQSIVVITPNAGAVVGDFFIGSGLKLLGESGSGTTNGIDIGFSAVSQAAISRGVIQGVTMFGWGQLSIAVGPNPGGAYQSHKISGVHIYNSNTRNVAGNGAIRLDACNGVAVQGVTAAQGANMYYLLELSTSAANLFIEGNDGSQCVTGVINYNGVTPTTSYITNNKGVDDVLGPVIFSKARAYQQINYISAETGANNAIAGALVDSSGANVSLVAGLFVVQKLGHTLQAGANTYNLNGGGAVAIKSSRNVANNIATAYAATGVVRLMYDGTEWLDMSQ